MQNASQILFINITFGSYLLKTNDDDSTDDYTSNTPLKYFEVHTDVMLSFFTALNHQYQCDKRHPACPLHPKTPDFSPLDRHWVTTQSF